MTTSAVPKLNMAALMGDPNTNPIPATPLENQLATVTPDDAAAEAVEEARFQFRSLLAPDQLAQLKAAAPNVSERMVNDTSAIISFGAPVLDRLNAAATQMLEAQSSIEIPEADLIVGDLLREMDGYKAKYRNEKLEDFVSRVKDIFKSTKYSFQAMVQDSKPIVEKLDIAAGRLQQMEIDLQDNQSRGRQLHKIILDSLDDAVGVLAALEEVQEVTRREAEEADRVLRAAESEVDHGVGNVTWKGETISTNEMREIHAQLASALSQMEQSWFDWRQQFFMGYAQAPSVRNIALVSATMERRCQSLRTMGIPSAKMTLAAWQQAMLAKEAGEMGDAVNKGINDLTQEAFRSMGSTVAEVARSSQAPIITEETVFVVVDSIREQCEGLVAADKWGREQRARNLKALEAGERQVSSDYSASRRELIANAIAATSPDADQTSVSEDS